ncbi:MAG TPA: hypothetical protein VKA21_01315 [Candidatus Binatia bacterium]|nr:hypothetical protein [Candidatus Binatia bacterium]
MRRAACLLAGVVAVGGACTRHPPKPLRCMARSVAIIAPGTTIPIDATFTMAGRASVVVCEDDVPKLTPDVRAALERELRAIVRQETFHMLAICADQGLVSAYDDERREMIERFDRVIGTPIVRHVDCAFASAPQR